MLNKNDIKPIQQKIDKIITKVWINHISNDYRNFYLLKEDSLKNALYFHIRNHLTDEFMDEHHIRIYTEYHYNGMIADLAIVQLNDNPGCNDHLKKDVISVLAIIEVKYKTGVSDKPFNEDVNKIKKYLDSSPIVETQYYLAFIQEVVYERGEDISWVTKRQRKWASGRLTELVAYFSGEDELDVWRIISH